MTEYFEKNIKALYDYAGIPVPEYILKLDEENKDCNWYPAFMDAINSGRCVIPPHIVKDILEIYDHSEHGYEDITGPYDVVEYVHFSMGFCGCGTPGEVAKLFYDILRLLRIRRLRLKTVDTIKVPIEEKILHSVMSLYPTKRAFLYEVNQQILWEFILHILDSKGLTEHGGSVYGSWLSDKGKSVYRILHWAFNELKQRG